MKRISTFFPEYSELFAKPEPSKLRLRDLLTMTAGLSWDEWSHPYTDARNDVLKMIRDTDPIRYVLGRTVEVSARDEVHLQQRHIHRAGPDHPQGLRTADRQVCRAFSVRAARYQRLLLDQVPRRHRRNRRWALSQAGDMAKLGRLFLNKGRSNGKQIVSEAWVAESTKNQLGSVRLPDGRLRRWLRLSMVAHSVQVRQRERRVL